MTYQISTAWTTDADLRGTIKAATTAACATVTTDVVAVSYA